MAATVGGGRQGAAALLGVVFHVLVHRIGLTREGAEHDVGRFGASDGRFGEVDAALVVEAIFGRELAAADDGPGAELAVLFVEVQGPGAASEETALLFVVVEPSFRTLDDLLLEGALDVAGICRRILEDSGGRTWGHTRSGRRRCF